MLRPSKAELDSIEAMLVAGAESPRDLAHDVIQEVERLRGEREQFFTVVELSPGIYSGEGPYATDHMARKGAVKNLWITEFERRWSVVSVYSQAYNLRRQKELADKPPTARGDWAEVALDQQAFKNGWDGKHATRSRYLST